MDNITTGDIRENFADVINHVAYGKERVVINRRSKPMAALVPMEDLALIQALEDQLDATDAKAALKDIAKHGAILWDKVKADLKSKRK